MACGAVGSALAITRLIFFSSSIRWSCVGSRPAVSAMTTSMPRALAAWIASKITAPGSPPCWEMTATRFRSPQASSCSRAAARNVSPAASSTDRPSPCSHFASLPIEVVFPAPLTPATMITNGLCAVTWNGRSSGARSRASSPANASFSADGVSMRSWPARARSRSSSLRVASRPASAEMSAVSSASNSSASTRAPTNSPASCEPVCFSPRLRRSNHEAPGG